MESKGGRTRRGLWLENFIVAGLVVFVVTLVEDFSKDVFKNWPGSIFLPLVVLMICTIGVLWRRRKEINQQLDQISVVSLWASETGELTEGYDHTAEYVRQAEESITVIGHFSPKGSTLRYADQRKGYLMAIEGMIKERLDKPNAPAITYRRIMQHDGLIPGGILRAEHLDRQTFEHYVRVAKLFAGEKVVASDNGNQEIAKNGAVVHDASTSQIVGAGKNSQNIIHQLLRSDHIPSFPNTLIVDRKFILFSLSTRVVIQSDTLDGSNDSDPEAEEHNKLEEYDNVGVFALEDRTGQTADAFVNAFLRFRKYSQGMRYVEFYDDEQARVRRLPLYPSTKANTPVKSKHADNSNSSLAGTTWSPATTLTRPEFADSSNKGDL